MYNILQLTILTNTYLIINLEKRTISFSIMLVGHMKIKTRLKLINNAKWKGL